MQDHVEPSTPLHALTGIVRPVTFIDALRLSRRTGASVTIASETFQYTGSFKYRAAYHLAANVPHRHIITASSGNFGQALAYACQQLNKTCHVVMPHTAVPFKIDAVREFGGIVDLIDVGQISRQQRVEELGRQFPDAYLASAYDDPFVIAGNATLGTELAAFPKPWDYILAPVGGGGLTAGIVAGLRQARHPLRPRSGQASAVLGVEPLLANDAARSWRAGRIVKNEREPLTIADGVRTVSLGQRNWEILRDGLAGIVEVTEDEIEEAARLLYTHANLKAEPTGALAIAALLHDPERFRGRSVCCVVSGGNTVEPIGRAKADLPT